MKSDEVWTISCHRCFAPFSVKVSIWIVCSLLSNLILHTKLSRTKIYSHITIATDPDNVEFVFAAVKHTILSSIMDEIFRSEIFVWRRDKEFSWYTEIVLKQSELCTTTSRYNNKPCVFPFIYKDISYSQCTKVEHNQLWCPTEVDAYGKYISGKYGECNSNCGTGTLIYRFIN